MSDEVVESSSVEQVLARVDSAGEWLTNTLTRLAESLGTTIEYLWPMYIKEVVAHGVRSMFLGVFFCVFGVILSKAMNRLSKRTEKDPEFPAFFGWVALIIGIILSACYISSGITEVIAPEPQALSNLTEAIRRLK